VRLDVFRGLALLIIFITHIPGLAFAGLTPRAFGFADAAEAFVLLAGLSAYFAFARPFLSSPLRMSTVARGSMPIFTRVWQLYITHVALVILITGILAYAARRFGDPEYLESGGLDILLNAPAEAVLGIVSLTFLPHFLDILPLYILLLAAMPFVVLAFRVHALLPLTLSVAMYACAQATGLNLPNINASSVWFFNPFAWQLLFVLGLTVSHLGAAGRLAAIFDRTALVGMVTALAVAVVAFTFLAAAPWRQFGVLANVEALDATLLPVADKTNLSPLRLVDALAKFWLIAVLVSRSAAWLGNAGGRLLALAGRHSLPVFVLGLVLSTIATVLIKEAGYAMWAQSVVTLAGVALMIVFAALLDWQTVHAKKDAAARAAPAREPDMVRGSGVALAKVVAEPSTK
jgi:hypothetical protein